jgi:cold shock CspA family protein
MRYRLHRFCRHSGSRIPVFVHISALNRIGLTELTHGQLFSYELKDTGKASKMAVNLKLLGDDEQAAA